MASSGPGVINLTTGIANALIDCCPADPNRDKPGRDLGYTRYDKIAETLGCHGEYVVKAEDIRPALERAQKKVDQGMVAVVNVRTDYRARAATMKFAQYST